MYHSADRDQTLSSMLGDNFFEEILHVLPRQVVLAVLCNYFCLVFAFATRVQKRVPFSFAWVAFLENVWQSETQKTHIILKKVGSSKIFNIEGFVLGYSSNSND